MRMSVWSSRRVLFRSAVARVLRPGGKAAVQFISIDEAIFEGYARNADFIQAYIFPGGLLIAERRFRAIAEGHGLSWEERKGYAAHYAETLRRWRERFAAAVGEARLPPGFEAHFHRLWRSYPMFCHGGFRRTEERGEGEACCSTGRSGGSP